MKRRFSVIFFALAYALLFMPRQTFAVTECCCRYTNGINTGTCESLDRAVDETCASYKGSEEWKTSDNANLCSSSTGGTAPQTKPKNPIIFIPNITIPGSDVFVKGGHVAINGKSIGEYVSAFYSFFAGVIGMIAAVMILFGGFQWMTAGGNAGTVQKAKTTIYSSLIAIVLTLGSYLMLYTINPQLVQIRDLSSLVTPVPAIPEEEPELYSEALVGNTTARSLKRQYDAQSCPTDTATLKSGFPVFLTGYYRPAWGAVGGYGSFACNLAMQCWCPHNQQASACGPVTGYDRTWQPCDLSRVDPSSYCMGTSMSTQGNPVPPVGLYEPGTLKTAAVNTSCFGRGTTFTVTSKNGGVPANVAAATWIAQDTGGAILGSHMDLFMGAGSAAYQTALQLKGEAMLVVKHYCPPSGGTCVDL